MAYVVVVVVVLAVAAATVPAPMGERLEGRCREAIASTAKRTGMGRRQAMTTSLSPGAMLAPPRC
jgi:hypothetical protein